MYEEHVLEHFGNPYHKGPMPPGPLSVYSGKSVSVVCGDKVEIQACITNGFIDDIWWQGDGCCFSQAASSMFVKYADRKTVDEIKQFSEDDMLELFQAECPDARKGCVLVALHALRKLLENIE